MKHIKINSRGKFSKLENDVKNIREKCRLNAKMFGTGFLWVVEVTFFQKLKHSKLKPSSRPLVGSKTFLLIHTMSAKRIV